MLRIFLVLAALLLLGAGSANAAAPPRPDGTQEGLVRATLAANPDSVRVGANDIRLAPGVTMTLPDARTGESRGRPCRVKYFCLYEHVGFSGSSLAMSACKVYLLRSYVFWNRQSQSWDDWANDASSFVNHQIGGVWARMWDDAGLWYRVGIGSDDMHVDWNDRPTRARPC
jgi:hypothetical protein